MSVQDVVEVVARQIALLKVNIGALEHIGQANVDPSVCGRDVGELALQEVEGGLVVPEATLEEESFSNATKPVLVHLGVGRVLPKGLHAVCGGRFLSGRVVSEDDRVDSTSRNTADCLVGDLIRGKRRGNPADDTSLVHGVLVSRREGKSVALIGSVYLFGESTDHCNCESLLHIHYLTKLIRKLIIKLETLLSYLA